MKKTLVALAALAATSAFADVTISGTFDPTLIHTRSDYQGATSVTQNNMTYNGVSTSQVTFKVSEDLGGGLKAIALMENDFQAQNKEDQIGKGADQGGASAGTNFGSGGGEIYTGLTGGMGTIKLGAPNTATLYTQGGTPFGTKLGSGFGEGLHGTAQVRQSQTAQYQSPVFGGGFVFTIGQSFGSQADANVVMSGAPAGPGGANGINATASVVDSGLMYANGPIMGNATMFKKAGLAGAPDNVITNVQGSYTFGGMMVQVGGHQETAAANTSGKDNSGLFVAGKYTSGASSFLFNLANLSDKTAANAAAPQNKHMTGLGYDYALSINTKLYARYSSYTFDNQAANILTKQTKTAAGISVNF